MSRPLFSYRLPEGRAVHMDMQATGSCLMAEVTKLFGFLQHLALGHLFLVVA